MREMQVSIGKYKIIISADADDLTRYLAGDLQSYLYKAIRQTLPVAEDTVRESECELVLGNTSRMEEKNLLQEEYVIRTQDKKLFILGEGRGLAYGMYSFLEKLGFRFLTPEVDVIPSAASVAIPFGLAERYCPKFVYREVMDRAAWDAKWSLKQKINGTFLRDLRKYGGGVGYVNGYDGLVHTFKHLIPPEVYYPTHPEYFSLKDGRRTDDPVNCQLCMTNTDLAEELAGRALEWLRKEEDPRMIHLSQNDDPHLCECEACKASNEKYNPSGTEMHPKS